MPLINALKGALIGVALVIPGLSGSIFAVIVGLYEPLLAAIAQFKKDWRQAIGFLWPIGIGAGIGVLLSTKIILWLCTAYPLTAYSFFIGLVVGSLPFIWRRLAGLNWQKVLIAIVCGAIMLLLTQIGGHQSESDIAIKQLTTLQDFGTLLFAGFFSVSLMLIPGVSGSIMLMIVKQYGTVYHAVSQLLDLMVYLVTGRLTQATEAFKSVALLLPFIIGAVIGTVIVAKLMHYLLAHFVEYVYAGVLGVVIAAIWILAQTGVTPAWPALTTATALLGPIALIIAMIILGTIATIYFDKA
ncbi:DUF368 domain-containing protein [Latilactobacillus curvatus]|uniref:DUF368 domain-containing protein n=1 Tax=Latilactobacillus curvatus TaxID=28038 RepID=A0A385AFM0_LATCU|nr:DUF368 domain-containing protein [Latilactobacillus curvatus]AXN36437.1 DUF368 domain-containing protein [Latilactobacillus curvatus]MCW8780784.1 DUF368 domain-containing protein [Latilactobacillus curvatus]UTB71688.1 DUF368 domain-containing protein [Latilactobacillus curvatus]UTC08382.1 DUF368 domain-containing protein [Latilactobacillus curvatus]